MMLSGLISCMHYELSLNKETKNDQIVCVESLKLSLLAKSCLTPGLVALITNLVKSSEDPPEEQRLPKGAEWEWLPEYWEGKSFEIYRVQIPKDCVKSKFCELSNFVFNRYGTVLFAIEIVENDKQHGPILLNPGSFELPPNKDKTVYTYFGYVIAGDKTEAEQSFNECVSLRGRNEKSDLNLMDDESETEINNNSFEEEGSGEEDKRGEEEDDNEI